MAPVPAYLLSVLGRQLLLGDAGFRKRYPDSWLVWETGDPALVTDPESQELLTRLPRARYPERPASGDPLCFLIAGDNGAVVDIGRAAENDIRIGESSVSRQHCRLTKLNGLWHVSRLNDAMPMSLDHHPVTSGHVVGLSARHELVLGNVLLTFHSTASLIDRLQGRVDAQSAAGE